MWSEMLAQYHDANANGMSSEMPWNMIRMFQEYEYLCLLRMSKNNSKTMRQKCSQNLIRKVHGIWLKMNRDCEPEMCIQCTVMHLFHLHVHVFKGYTDNSYHIIALAENLYANVWKLPLEQFICRRTNQSVCINLMFAHQQYAWVLFNSWISATITDKNGHWRADRNIPIYDTTVGRDTCCGIKCASLLF